MRKKRLRKPGDPETDQPADPPRPTRVRNRLLVSVALCSVAVLGAGTPGIVESATTLTESQELVERAALHQQAIALAHSLSDERGDMIEYVAAGRTDPDTAGATPTTDAQRARVDRQISELLASEAVTPPVKQALKGLPRTRQEVLVGKGTAYDAFQAYTAVIQQLHDISRSVARSLPGDVESGSTAAAAVATTESLPHLGRAVEQASATRGLLRGAFAGGGPQGTLTEAAQLARVREQAALADFEQTAGTAAGETFDKTVTGTDVGLAERFVEQLTEDRTLGPTDRALKSERVVSALSARIDRMRSVQSSLATAEVARLEQQRDDDVTALELRIALVGACLLLAAGVSVHTARSLSRPLSVLKRGSKRLASSSEPAEEEPVRFTGRNDEFAEVVRSLNELRETAAELHTRATEAEADNAYLVSSKDELTAERERLREECETLRSRLETAHGATHGTFVHLGLRTLGLVERQLGILEALEAEESDAEELATLFKLDHLATRIRRAGENLLLLAGAEHTATHHSGPVPLLDVLRAAVSEIERYERVQLASLPPHAQVSGFAADDVSHLVAELLDNATAFSAPDADVTLSAWMLENGEIMLSVQDDGIGVAPDRLTELNARLGDPAAQDAPGGEGDDAEGLGNGLYVVARLAVRHGLRVQLREQKAGGIAAVVILPRALLPDRPVPGTAGPAAAPDGAGAHLPGSVAEANSNALPSRRPATSENPPPDPAGEAPARAAGLPVRVPGGDPQTASWSTGSGDGPVPTDDGSESPGREPGTAEEQATVAGEPAGEQPPSDATTHGRLAPSTAVPSDAASETGAGGADGADSAAGAEAGSRDVEPPTRTPDGPVPAAGERLSGDDTAPRLTDTVEALFDASREDGEPETGNGSGDRSEGVRTPTGLPTRVPGAAPAAGEPPAGLDLGPTDAPGSLFRDADSEPEHGGPATAAPQTPDDRGGTAADVPQPRPGDEHARAEDDETAATGTRDGDGAHEGGAHEGGAHEDVAHHDGAGEDAHGRGPVVTDKGLPKRTPRHVATEESALPRQSGGAANAEELRRRLGGFQRGARDGHRDAAAEVAAHGAAGRGGKDEEAQQ